MILAMIIQLGVNDKDEEVALFAKIFGNKKPFVQITHSDGVKMSLLIVAVHNCA